MQNKKGFTLVELAVVMTIIGLLVGGILKFQELRKNAELQHTIKAFNGLMAGVTSFRDLYNGLPGDMGKATRKITGCTAANYCIDGNTDGKIGMTTGTNWIWYQSRSSTLPEVETTLFWKHLFLAGFITGINPSSQPGTPDFGSTHFPLPMGGGLMVAYHDKYDADTPPNTGVSGHFLQLSSRARGGKKQLRPRDSKYIDVKMDDGSPNNGSVFAEHVSTGCKDNDYANGRYNIESSQENCSTWYNLGY